MCIERRRSAGAHLFISTFWIADYTKQARLEGRHTHVYAHTQSHVMTVLFTNINLQKCMIVNVFCWLDIFTTGRSHGPSLKELISCVLVWSFLFTVPKYGSKDALITRVRWHVCRWLATFLDSETGILLYLDPRRPCHSDSTWPSLN